MTKNEARERAIAKRDGLDGELILEKSRVIFEKVTALTEYIEAENILVYASMRSEADTFELILDALSGGKRVFCPKVTDKKNGLMKFVPISSIEDLVEGYFGIREPVLPEGYKEPEFDLWKTLMIMPGVAFDKDRNRVGYSGGFYDRYLYGHKGLKAIAIAFECQVMDDIIEMDHYDIRPDMLITEESTY
ncbi:5-formyltetrahydrofolate cyclo-ligase [Butyrivibrio sp. CB08]|uniref:5-formyltetrahydrofolate cyclo-ligase n=1 Tax=Butyrivibrio sp. CB08 TaxID=2364879 RepID=UPI001314D33A|nr:5-formyltetrahydrofolate cyclo-ligase [Butyrivibrio sp. CB08]